jgi:hypothetical protein
MVAARVTGEWLYDWWKLRSQRQDAQRKLEEQAHGC